MTKRKLSRSNAWIIAGMAVMAIMLFIFVQRPVFSKTDSAIDPIATVNGEPVQVNEFQRAVQANKARVIDYFYEKYGAVQSASFWTASYGGEVPIERLKKKALEESVNLKIQQIIAKEQGVLTDIRYSVFLQNLSDENERRKKAIEKKEVVFGPAQYTEDAYFEYVMTNAILSVKKRFMEHDWKPDEHQLKQFYETKKSELYQAPAAVNVRLLSISFPKADSDEDERLKARAKQKIEAASTKISNGMTFEQAAKEIGPDGQVTEQSYPLDRFRHNAASPVAQAASMLQAGEISGIIEENGRFFLVQCLENVKAGSRYLSFDAVKDQALKDYIDDRYASYVRQRVSEAKVVVNDRLYKPFQM
ncbi:MULTISPECIES: peptidyl-prolyl cis-trans isomerase [Paenibacillus]|uniref:peptidylprolyl isomerase n=1 Tax=Paenibacillus albilobatus TaxID=2716884 RepID=A0A919XMQ1_9BACL|nr:MULTISPECIES: peptidyl-prolyl cis-trans isomerase [Paenibacillus]GIO34589.1 hypothetical protein J2TS6_57300 [Paenibacillus albilobatus]